MTTTDDRTSTPTAGGEGGSRLLRLEVRRPWSRWDRMARLSGVGLVAGLPLIVVSYRYAASHANGQGAFDLFWIGFLLFAVPVAWRALSATVSRRQRLSLVVVLGFWEFVPKLLRNPGGPLFADELAHWRQSIDVATSGHLYPANTLIPLIREFPGQQALVAAVHDASGLSVWWSSDLLVALLHASSLVGLFLLGEGLIGSARAGAVVAVLYCLNPGFLFFDAQVSYESFGLPLLIWTLVSAMRLAERDRSAASRRAWLVAGIVTGLACVVTHHLSSYVLAAVLLATAVAARFGWGRVRPAEGVEGGGRGDA